VSSADPAYGASFVDRGGKLRVRTVAMLVAEREDLLAALHEIAERTECDCADRVDAVQTPEGWEGSFDRCVNCRASAAIAKAEA
jgi:hypothetical protein